MKRFLLYAQSNRKELERFIKFMVVGVIGAVVDFGTFNLLTGLGNLTAEVASTISFVMAICSNFIWNRYWTYPDSRSKRIGHQFVQFFIVNVLGIVIRLPIIAFTKDPFGRLVAQLLSVDSATAKTLGNNLALATAVVIVMFWNFFVNRYWTYGDVDLDRWSEVQPAGVPEPTAGQEGR